MQQKIEQYRAMLQKDPRSKAFVPLAEIYRKMSLLDDALEVAEQGVQHLPGYSLGFVVLARIQAQRGLLEESIGTFEQALELDGDNVDALKGLAKIQIARDNNRRARDLLVRVLSLRPEDKASRQMLDILGPPPETPEYHDEQKSAEDVDFITTATIADIYIKQGYPRRALQVFSELLASNPSSEPFRKRVKELELQLGEHEESAAGIGTVDASVESAPVETVPPVVEVAALEPSSTVSSSFPSTVALETPPVSVEDSADSAESNSPLHTADSFWAQGLAQEPSSVPDVPDTQEAVVDELSLWLDAIVSHRQNR